MSSKTADTIKIMLRKAYEEGWIDSNLSEDNFSEDNYWQASYNLSSTKQFADNSVHLLIDASPTMPPARYLQ